MNKKVIVVGGGLAGCEAAYRIAEAGFPVELAEMKPVRFSPAHENENLAELVCSNSLKAKRLGSAAGLLKAEMLRLGSVTVEAALQTKVPAGGALAVDREKFAALVTTKINSHPNITVTRREVTEIPDADAVVIAAGPLVSDALGEKISALTGGFLNFYDAAAPIVTVDSIDMDAAFVKSRYDRGGDDYINCPLNKEEYERFHAALVSAETAELHSFDKRKKVYEGCMPIEIMAARGADTVRFGPMKPVGLRDPRTGHRPWAVLQLRKENESATMYNLLGFQTYLKFGEQKRVFSMIPALKDAEFVRYGVMHRNSFIHAPTLLKKNYSLIQKENLFFAGQITGVEGYMESAGAGILAGINAARYLRGEPPFVLPEITMLGALTAYITDGAIKDFQPMGASFGLLPPLEEKIRDKKQRYEALAARSMAFFDTLKI
ncbi:MAG: methylenetetrahydrofolate--tRNA-(uracil(54)-C(5))-methyltransferase (FADH(2)-oxidizing) TrmFO [Clostridia bacterium]|nr:methylenetetrahydrofolate--tRNA-(uracil(54)-C(5))-methyltransferase (FADH(2)-oxidizing) TrmFO [Clostridia bacterium]